MPNERKTRYYLPALEVFHKEANREIDPDQLFGFHGMSIHTLRYVLQTGVIPGHTEPEKVTQHIELRRGDLFVSRIIEPQHGSIERAFKNAAGYAETVARAHEFSLQLRLDLTDETIQRAVYELTDDFVFDSAAPYRALLNDMGISDARIEEARAMSLASEGVVVGIHASVEKKFPVADASPDDGWKIITNGGGVSFEFIYGFYPQGNSAQKQIASWK